MREPLIGSLCSGYGGLDQALIAALDTGRVAWHAQYEPPDKNGKPDVHQWPSQILAYRYPGVPNHGDITAIDYTAVERIDVLTAGFPCQDISLAGRGAGIAPGTRSGLWAHVAHAVAALRPSLVFIENVRSLTSAKAHSKVERCPWCMGGPGTHRVLRALGAVLGDLADLGFDAEWICLPASDVGAPHERERCFVAAWPAEPASDTDDFRAHRGRARSPRRDEPAARREPAADPRCDPRSQDHPHLTVAAGSGGQAAADPGHRDQPERPRTTRRPARERFPERELTGRGGQDPAYWGEYRPAIVRWESVTGVPAPAPADQDGRLTSAFVEWMMGLPPGWVTAVPGVPRTAQLKALGNGVVPQQGTAALRAMADRSAPLRRVLDALTRSAIDLAA